MYMMKMELIDEKSIFQKFIQKNNAKLPEKWPCTTVVHAVDEYNDDEWQLLCAY